jgi:folate-dependent phosphoribosylglycinamide formyltransferase PurN
MTATFNIATLISGTGRTMLNLADRIEAGQLPIKLTCVVASREDAPGIALARQRGLLVHSPPANLNATERDCWVRDVLDPDVIDLVCLCGYLRPFPLTDPWEGRVINIHPALLPDFGGQGMYGSRVHEAVLAAGKDVSGCTIHFVNNEYDTGPIILQRRCEVQATDTPSQLAARVFALECEAYPEAIQLIATKKIRLNDKEVEHDPPQIV